MDITTQTAGETAPKTKEVKSVSYFYPTSTNAERFNLPKGGYCVDVTKVNLVKRTANTRAVAGFATEQEANEHAITIALEWASWSAQKAA